MNLLGRSGLLTKPLGMVLVSATWTSASRRNSTWGISRKRTRGHRDLEFRLDSFDVFNHVNARSFIGTLSSPFFGRANSAYPARELQASVRFSF